MICDECKLRRHTYCEAPKTCPCQHREVDAEGRPLDDDALRRLADVSPTLYGDLRPSS